MLSDILARDKVARLVDHARRIGADAADAAYVGDRSTSVGVRLGELEDVSRSEGEEVGLRVFVGKRNASVASSDMSEEALVALAQRALAMAREAPEDEFAGLAPTELLMREAPRDLDMDDGSDPDAASLRARALAAEEAARGVAGVTNSNGGSASASATVFAVAASNGFAAVTRSTGHSVSAGVVAGEGSAMQRDYAWHSARHLDDLDDPAEVGLRAGTRAAARVGPVRVEAGTMAVLFDPRVATSLLGHLAGAISGSAIARKSSFLLDAMGTRVFAPGVTVRDDPFRPRGLRSRAFDGEGLSVRPMAVIDDGVLTSWFAESASARQLGIDPTGHAVRGVSGAPGAGPANFYIEAGGRSREAMIGEQKRAILVTELIGQGVNPVTGDYSRGASGFLIENGEVVGPVSGLTIASTLQAMFATLEPASDLVFRRGVDAPTLLVPEMTVA